MCRHLVSEPSSGQHEVESLNPKPKTMGSILGFGV